MALEGDLSIFRLPDILQVIAQQQKTGILTVQGEHDILAVSFHRGEIVAADALNQSFEEMLGEVLASQGVLPPERFQRLAEEHRTTAGERLADFLIRRDAITREQLLAALRFQTYRLLLEVLRWRQGEFKFYTGEEVAFEEGMEPLAVDEVLFRSMRDLLGEGTVAGAMPHGFVAYERIPSKRPLRVAREGAIVPEASGDDVIWISLDEETVLDRLDGRTRAAQVAIESGLGEMRTQYALFHLLRVGLVRPSAEHTTAGTAAGVASPAPEPPPIVTTVREITRVDEPPAPPPELQPVAPARLPVELPLRAEVDRRLDATGTGTGTGVRRAPVRPLPAGRVAAAGAAAGLIAALLIVGLAAFRPGRLLQPFPTGVEARASFVQLERRARFATIDRASRTFYLLEGRYPASLEDLAGRGLLARQQRFDPHGQRLILEPTEDAYRLTVDGMMPEAGGEVLESVSGDVLLDRALFAQVQAEAGVPLVLLD